MSIPSDLRVIMLFALFAGVFFSGITVIAAAAFLPMFVLLAILLLRSPYLSLHPVAVVILINFSYWLVSGFVTGAISVFDLPTLGFANGEGRIFIYYIPLIVLLMIPVQSRMLRLLGMAFRATIFAGIVLLVATYIVPGLGGRKLFHGFTSSHHVFGSLTGLASILFITELFHKKSLSTVFYLVGSLILLLACGSRMSLMALALALTWLLVSRREFRVLVVGAVCLASTLVVGGALFDHFERRVVRLLSTDTVILVYDQFLFTYINFEAGGEGRVVDNEIIGREHNVLTRAALWASATKNLFNSPILGLGFGRANDYVTGFTGKKGYIWLATDGRKRFNAGTAHNSYFQIAQETGIIGLLLIGWLWVEAFVWLGRVKSSPVSQRAPGLVVFAEAARAMIVFTSGSALTGHSFASPALGVPLTLTVGVVLGAHRLLSLEKGTEVSEGKQQVLADGVV